MQTTGPIQQELGRDRAALTQATVTLVQPHGLELQVVQRHFLGWEYVSVVVQHVLKELSRLGMWISGKHLPAKCEALRSNPSTHTKSLGHYLTFF